MNLSTRSIRSFIGAKDYALSRAFYRALGFAEVEIGPKMCLFRVSDRLAFYLQDYYAKEWIENTMLFLEVENLDDWVQYLATKKLATSFAGVRISAIREEDWGRELFMHDPAGVLWHIGEFR